MFNTRPAVLPPERTCSRGAWPAMGSFVPDALLLQEDEPPRDLTEREQDDWYEAKESAEGQRIPDVH